MVASKSRTSTKLRKASEGAFKSPGGTDMEAIYLITDGKCDIKDRLKERKSKAGPDLNSVFFLVCFFAVSWGWF